MCSEWSAVTLPLHGGAYVVTSSIPDLVAVSSALRRQHPRLSHQFLPGTRSIFSMSSTVQATSSTSNVQIIINAALANYVKITGTDLSKTPFAVALEQSNSPEVILQLLQEREKAFNEYRDGNRRLMKCVSLAVKVIQPFSGIIREAVSQVSRPSHPVTLLTVASSDPLPTNECPVCRHRCSPCCMSLESDFQRVP